jgi:hypothetical protein
MAPAPTTAIRIDQIICELAGQGRRVLMGVLGVVLPQDLQRTNALENALTALVNGVAGLYFAFAADVEWGPRGSSPARRSSAASSGRTTAGGYTPPCCAV